MDCAEAILARKRFPVKMVCRALKIARSNLLRRRRLNEKKRPGPSPKDDAGLLPALREIVDRRPTYGYRRIQAVLNRRRKTEGGLPVNHKRVYRILKGNTLLLTRGISRPERSHEGRVIALSPNSRWCSDVFEIPCDSGERVRVAFSLDACDREILSYVATTGGIGGDSIRDLILQSVESRFGSIDRLPHPIEWLSDNGSCYTAHETRRFAHDLGFRVCRTPVKSPESNGMAESFVKTFKRDYVSLHSCPDGLTVLKQLFHWFEDYNEHHPHKGLKMRSPREFRSAYLSQTGCPIN